MTEQQWALCLAYGLKPDKHGVCEIEMLSNEESSLGLVATIHAPDRKSIWWIKIENGVPVLEKHGRLE